MKRLALVFLALLVSAPALAQAVVTPCYLTENIRSGATVENCTPAASPQSTTALAANLVAKATPGNLASLEVSADSTLSGAAWWLMAYDAVAAPADGAVTPKKCWAMASGVTTFNQSWAIPLQFSTGIVLGVSTTGCFTKTQSVHAHISADTL